MVVDAEFRVTDLKQYAYCPRIPFYQNVMGFTGKSTYKMQRGHEAQAAIEALERRRKLREYGLSDGRRHFGPWLFSNQLHLSGKLDLLVETPSACFPIDFKYTTGRPHHNHRIQLAAYALLIEESFHKPVPAGFVFLTIADVVVQIPINEELRNEVRSALAALRTMVQLEVFPGPTSVRARCTDCEYRNFCADVF